MDGKPERGRSSKKTNIAKIYKGHDVLKRKVKQNR